MNMSFVDPITFVALVAVGFWLEGINGIHGFFDELLSPVPVSLAATGFILARHIQDLPI